MATGRVYTTEAGVLVHGMMAEYTNAADVYHAAEKFRDAGYMAWDVHSPFPIHGIEEAMGIKPTVLPAIIAVVGLTGSGLALLMQWWMSAVDYPLVVQGKPYFSWQAFVPIIFELGILSAAFTALIGMLAMNGLPRHNHPLMKKDRFLHATQDALFIAVEARDPKFDPEATRRLFETTGATLIDLVEDE
jgi:hypothetical protein